MNSDDELRILLRTLDPSTRDNLRRVLIRDDADRDAIAMQLMRYRDASGQGWADIIDMLTLYPEARRRVARASARSTPRRHRWSVRSSPDDGNPVDLEPVTAAASDRERRQQR